MSRPKNNYPPKGTRTQLCRDQGCLATAEACWKAGVCLDKDKLTVGEVVEMLKVIRRYFEMHPDGLS